MSASGLDLENSATPALFLFLMVLMANLPWLSERYWAVLRAKSSTKSRPLRWLEWLAGAFVLWLLGVLLESRDGDVTPQGPVFILIYGLLFVIVSFPGLVYHHFLKAGREPGSSEESRGSDESL